MTDDFRINVPFEKRLPRLKDLMSNHVMGDGWVRDTKKCIDELSIQPKFGLNKNIKENSSLGGAKGKERQSLKYDITEFGLALLLLYINTLKARLISAEISTASLFSKPICLI